MIEYHFKTVITAAKEPAKIYAIAFFAAPTLKLAVEAGIRFAESMSIAGFMQENNWTNSQHDKTGFDFAERTSRDRKYVLKTKAITKDLHEREVIRINNKAAEDHYRYGIF